MCRRELEDGNSVKAPMESDYLFMGGVFLDQIWPHYSLGPPHPEIKVRFWSGPLEDP